VSKRVGTERLIHEGMPDGQKTECVSQRVAILKSTLKSLSSFGTEFHATGLT